MAYCRRVKFYDHLKGTNLHIAEMKFMRRRGRNLSSTPTKKQQEDIALLTNKVG